LRAGLIGSITIHERRRPRRARPLTKVSSDEDGNEREAADKTADLDETRIRVLATLEVDRAVADGEAD